MVGVKFFRFIALVLIVTSLVTSLLAVSSESIFSIDWTMATHDKIYVGAFNVRTDYTKVAQVETGENVECATTSSTADFLDYLEKIYKGKWSCSDGKSKIADAQDGVNSTRASLIFTVIFAFIGLGTMFLNFANVPKADLICALFSFLTFAMYIVSMAVIKSAFGPIDKINCSGKADHKFNLSWEWGFGMLVMGCIFYFFITILFVIVHRIRQKRAGYEETPALVE
eukprot:TRINITY_DN1615_c0_g1_i1.p1 TRINITY_DN1615_c0_g1~~TRINITY_DN1615_c0_g1_i1.p1  ORF type:complete len:226 (-),score=40.28 TRINITY_DN1615_c0_g1_i1:168-845(-)